MVTIAPTDGEYSSFPEIHRKTVDVLRKCEYTHLFPIQQECFYPIYQREDVLARDLTGSGKTIAFALPTVEYLRRNKCLGTRKVQAIVLAPTRELALQVTKEIEKLKHYDSEFRIVTVYGGVNIDDQIRQLKHGVDIFVGTTGRVLDHIDRGNIDFGDLKTLVLDEADQMLKLGFKEDVDKIFAQVQRVCDTKRLQVCLFSATIPPWVKQITRAYMKKSYRIVDLAQDLKNKTAKQVAHLAIDCPYVNRMSALADVLTCYGGNSKTIVFTQTKQDANSLVLSDKIKLDVEVMHGDIAQNQREVTMKRFKEGKFQVLVATDVAARGLDISGIELIIQIEPPKDVETYIHRSGRTARAGKSGTCITFYTKKTYELIQKIEDSAGIKFKRIGVPQAEDVIRASSRDILKNMKDVNTDVIHLFEDTAQVLIDQHDGDAARALQVALAFCSGFYKHKLQARSLLNGQEGHTTVQMTVPRGNLEFRNAHGILRKYWEPRVIENVRNMKGFKDGSGVVFDLRSDNYDAFMENYERLKETEARVDFELAKCTDLPELEEDGGYGGYGGNWRDQGRDNYSKPGRGSGGGGGGYQGNKGGYQQDRGDWGRGNQGYGGSSRGYDDYRGGSSNGGGSGASWREPDNSRGGGFQRRGGYQQPESNYQGTMGFSSDYKPRTAAAPSGNAPIIGNRQQKTRGSGSGVCVYVSNLKYSATEQEILDFFKENKFDPVRARLLYDAEGNSKGYGFVELSSEGEAEEAIKQLNGEQFQSRKVNVSLKN